LSYFVSVRSIALALCEEVKEKKFLPRRTQFHPVWRTSKTPYRRRNHRVAKYKGLGAFGSGVKGVCPARRTHEEGGATRPFCFRSRERLSKTETKIIPPRRRCYFSSRKPWKPARPARKGLEGHRRRSESGREPGGEQPPFSPGARGSPPPSRVTCYSSLPAAENSASEDIGDGVVIPRP